MNLLDFEVKRSKLKVMTRKRPNVVKMYFWEHFVSTEHNAVVTCEIKLFQNYFRSLILQIMNIFEHIQCR